MNADPLESLLEKLCNGDDVAAERVFAAYEPLLRKVVRRQLPGRLRAKFDSGDVVQSVWADVLHGFREAGWRFSDTAHLRAFLVKVTRNRFIDRCRQHNTVLRREQPVQGSELDKASASRQPRPSEVVQADDLWQQMLALCPPAYHELLRLKRQGLSLREIAEQTGLHGDSVRRILRNLARQLAFRQQSVASPATKGP
jgi:RNA polymerase sigma-70 factor (ECF subfamily)